MSDATNQENEPGFTIRPVTAIQNGPPPTVQFVGVLSADPRLHHTTLPDAYRSHPLLQGQFFYTIPEQLLNTVCRPQTGESFTPDDELLALELALSRISGDHSCQIGFWNDLPIECNLLHQLVTSREFLERSGTYSPQQIDAILRALNGPVASFSRIACGFSGWLMSNPEFQNELISLRSQFRSQFHRWGTAQVGLPIPSNQRSGRFNPTNERGWEEFNSAVLEFCVRWRLQGLAGPRVPVPIRPMMSGSFPLTIVAQLMRAGGVFNWPDTFPLFARDELRDLLSGALGSPDREAHLAGWRRIIDSHNHAKNQIPALERRFRLQHFWRLLRERHPAAFDRRVNRIEYAFAQYFGVDESSIRLDRKKIAQSLGKDWDLPQPVAS